MSLVAIITISILILVVLYLTRFKLSNHADFMEDHVNAARISMQNIQSSQTSMEINGDTICNTDAKCAEKEVTAINPYKWGDRATRG
mgnify:CR=1 FL=1